MSGNLIGPDRKSGASPFRFGDDRTVGVATVAQIGGELSRAAADLLKAERLYAASALIRQLVEVEYLAHAFAHDHAVAAEWLRADRKERLAFWSPAAVRKRADGAFPAEDYRRHCDLGGHPTTEGRQLLPDHSTLNVAFLWVNLAGHLSRIWRNVVVAAEQVNGGPIPAGWVVPDVDGAIDAWHASDRFWEALQELEAVRREEGEEEDGKT